MTRRRFPQEKHEMATKQLTEGQKVEFADGTISSLMEWGPKLLPEIPQALREVDGMIQIRASFVGESSEGFRALQKSDSVRIRTMIEQRSTEIYGVKYRVDRLTVSEYMTVLAENNRTSADWLGDLPAWDETPRLKAFGEMFGVESSVYAGGHSPTENAHVCELAGRAMFMHPCYHSMGLKSPGDPVPMVVLVGCAPSDLRRFMAPILRGSTREVHTIVSTQQKFIESFDPFTSHILLPGLPQIVDAPYMADVTRFAGIVRDSSVHYRPPYAAQAVTVGLPMMVGSIPSDDWRRLGAGGTPILPLTVSETFPDAETIAQCYAEAMFYTRQGHPVVKRGLEGVRTVWDSKKGARP